jgi:hypothetical protein
MIGTEAVNSEDRFAGFVPTPKGKTTRHRAPVRSWPLGRRSGRVATAASPPSKPSFIILTRADKGNDLNESARRVARKTWPEIKGVTRGKHVPRFAPAATRLTLSSPNYYTPKPTS